MSGGVVARGRIKVDARKAHEKLRDHMLVDHHLYACEIARVAQALDATKISIEYDADDVVLTFDGHLLPIEEIARCRDYVLTPLENSSDADALRLLGIAVSAALALDPSFVDVIRVDDAPQATRVRFESHHTDEDLGADNPPAPQMIPRPKNAPSGSTTRIHVRKKMTLEMMARAVKPPVPRELRLLAGHGALSRLEMKMTPDEERTFGRGVGAHLLRVDLDEPSILRGFLEVLHPASTNIEGANTVSFCERGVVIARYPLVDCWNLVRDRSQLPIRVLVDAARLPTNASRSELRLDTDLIRRVRSRIGEAFETAVDALEAIAVRNEAPAHKTLAKRVELAAANQAAISSGDRTVALQALGIIIAELVLAIREQREVPERAKARAPGLLALPLLYNAVGVPIALSQVTKGRSKEEPLLIYSGDKPAPIELGPWLADVVWRRGLPAETALTGLHLAPAEALMARAQDGFARRQRALEHPPSLPTLPASPGYVLKESFAVSNGPFAGLKGEVAVVRIGPHYRRGATARLFVDQRPLESMPLPGVSLPVDLALEWPNRIIARFSYDAVDRNEDLNRAVLYALRIAATMIGERAAKVRGETDDAELVRLAIGSWAGATKSLGDADTLTDLSALGSLAREMVWPTTNNSLTSLEIIRTYVRRTGAICIAPAFSGEAVDGRPVIDQRFEGALKELLPTTTRIIPYASALGPQKNEPPRESTGGLPAIAFQRPNVRGFIAVAQPGSKTVNRRIVYHAGIRLADQMYRPRNGPVFVVLDDRGAVPSAQMDGLLCMTPLGNLDREEDALVDQVLTHVERGEIDHAAVKEYLDISRHNMRERLRDAPPNDDEPTSDADLRARSRSGRVSASAEDRARLDTLARRLAELPAVLARRRLLVAKAALLARPPVELEQVLGPGPRAWSKDDLGRVTVRLAGNDPPRAEVFFQGHFVCSRAIGDLPLVSIIETQREELLAEWSGLSPDGASWAHSAQIDAALELLRRLVTLDEFAHSMSALELFLALHSSIPVRANIALRGARWPTVQGGTMTLPDDPASLPSGTHAYAPNAYRAPLSAKDESAADAPALHLPKNELGDLRLQLFNVLGHDLVDVTDQVARVQLRRAKGLAVATPTLDGLPAHPLLRERLSELGLTTMEGEIEIIDGTTSEVWQLGEDGTKTWVPFSLQCAIRAVYRADDPRDSTTLVELARATSNFVRQLGRYHLEDVPFFIRARLRSLVCAELANRGRLDVGDWELPVFPSMRGEWHALGPLLGAARGANTKAKAAKDDQSRLPDVHVTRDLPPYPGLETLIHHGSALASIDPILVLTENETHALVQGAVRVRDVTDDLRRELRGARRRTDAPLSEIKLSDEMRAQCMTSFAFIDEGIRGEIGLLRPAYTASRRIEVHTTLRLLCHIPDPEGWPIISAINDDDVQPSPAFDGMNRSADSTRILRVVRNALAKQLPKLSLLDAPPDRLGTIRLPSPHLVRSILPRKGAANTPDGGHFVAAMGVFWLDPVWPERPEVRVEAIDVVDPYRQPSIPPTEDAQSRILPIRGKLWVSTDAANLGLALDDVFQWVHQRLATTLRQASKSTTSRAKKQDAKEQAAYEWDLALLGVSENPAKNPIAELATDRPSEALMRVAVRRAPHLLKNLRTEQDDAPLLHEEPTKIEPVVHTPASLPAETEQDTERPSFFDGLVRRVSGLFDPTVDRVSPPKSQLGQSLANALAAMSLTGNPVHGVSETKRGRPVSYDRRLGHVLLNIEHSTVKKLATHPSGALHLVAAAVSEINRELVQVTDAEELAIVRDLLRANEA